MTNFGWFYTTSVVPLFSRENINRSRVLKTGVVWYVPVCRYRIYIYIIYILIIVIGTICTMSWCKPILIDMHQSGRIVDRWYFDTEACQLIQFIPKGCSCSTVRMVCQGAIVASLSIRMCYQYSFIIESDAQFVIGANLWTIILLKIGRQLVDLLILCNNPIK